MIKLAFVITNHYSKYRRKGRDYLFNLLESIKNNISNDYEYIIIIMDNGSTNSIKEKFDEDKKIEYHIIKDQSKGGLTYAWNLGINIAIQKNNDIIINMNDDLIINKSINNFVEAINNHEYKNISLFGPMTDKGSAPNHQEFKSYKNEIEETSKLIFDPLKKKIEGYPLNGFCFAFTKKMYEKFNIKGWLFSRDIRDSWGGQEAEFYIRNKPKGLKNYIIKSCYIKHLKVYSWKDARSRTNGKKRENYEDYGNIILCSVYKK